MEITGQFHVPAALLLGKCLQIFFLIFKIFVISNNKRT